MSEGLEGRSAAGRWVIAAAVLGSGVAFLDGSVVNVALPRIGADLHSGLATQQWVLDGYLLTLSALLLLGGALGDRYGRRLVFEIGLVAFTLASVGCGLAPTGAALVGFRLLQGAGGALLVPGSLSLINSSIRAQDRSAAVGQWAGLTGVAGAVGPLVGGWLVGTSWRLVFFINIPLALAALLLTIRHVPESRDPAANGRPDLAGAVCVTAGLGGVTLALIEGPSRGWSAPVALIGLVGAAALAAFPFLDARSPAPLMPLSTFRSRQFVGANLTTLAVYGALGGALFLLSLQLQDTAGYSPLQAGLATLPITVIMLLLSPRVGALAERTGPRLPMTAGPLVVAAGLVVMSRIGREGGYPETVLPGLVLFGLGLATTVAPLTSTVLASVDERNVGAASGTNNAISRVAGLLAVALLPFISGMTGPGGVAAGFGRAMLISAAVCALGGVAALVTVRRGRKVDLYPLPGVNGACQSPSTCHPSDAA